MQDEQLTGASSASAELPFNSAVYSGINLARWAFFAPLLAEIRRLHPFSAVLDVGAGAGFFAGRLIKEGYRVTAIDGRQENVDVIRQEVPAVSAHVVDVQGKDALAPFSQVDMLFCAGLLYHLENPAGAVANLCSTDAQAMLIETQVAPGSEPVFRLVEEGVSVTQGLNYYAIVPSVTALARLFRLNGWPHVYVTKEAPDHPQFRETSKAHTLRKVLVVSRKPLISGIWSEIPDVRAKKGFHMKKTWRYWVKRIIGR